MFSLIRLLFRALAGRPVAQIIVGIAAIPIGGSISFASMTGEYIYPYWIVGGIGLAIVGVIFIFRGATSLLKPKSSVRQPMLQQAPYAGPGQYPQAPYAPPQYPQAPYGQPQPPYGQPPYPQAPYAPPPPPYGQPQYPQVPYGQPQYPQHGPYEQVHYPQQ